MGTLMKRRAFLQGLGILWAGWTLEGWAKPLETVRYAKSLFQVSETRNLMGTFVTITLFHPSREQGQTVLGQAFEGMEKMIQIFDRHDNRSALSYLNERGSIPNPPPELVQLLQRSLMIHFRTGGVFDPTIKPVLDLYEDQKEMDSLPQPAAIQACIDRVGADELKIGFHEIAFSKEGMGVTLDGIAKGTIVDKTMAFLQKKGIRHALVDAGGDLRVSGGRSDHLPWRIEVYHPDNPTPKAKDIITLREGAVATSGNYMVFFDREKVHHHILLPKSGHSPLWSASASVMAPSCEEADALATSLMLLDPEEGLALINPEKRLAAMLISREGKIGHSRGWPTTRTKEGGKEHV